MSTKKYYTVYKTTNLINEKIYIGFHSTNDLEDGYLGSGKLIKLAVEKYGPQNFKREFLAIFDNREEAEKLEAELVNKEFTQLDSNYNMSVGGNVLILSGKHHYMYGKTWEEAIGKEKADELRERVSKRFKGTKLSDEHKEKVVLAISDRWADPEYKKRMSDKRTGYIHDEETKRKISESNKGKIISEEHKEKVSNYQKKRYAEMSEEEKSLLYNDERNNKISKKLKGRDTSAWQDKVNKNPEKIRKTAEKHRGMKRSEESKRKMSESQKGKVFFYNPKTLEEKRFKVEEALIGWIRGRAPKCKS